MTRDASASSHAHANTTTAPEDLATRLPAPRDEPGPAAETGHGGRIIASLEAAWGALRRRHADIPQVVMITGTAKQAGGDRWGHYGADFWTVPAGERTRAPELFIAGELIALGGRRVLQTLLHEAAHGIAHARSIKDTSGDGNRYHNKRFVALAEEVGLQGPPQKERTHGWTACTLPETTATRYAEVIGQLDAARLPYLRTPGIPTTTGDDQDHHGDDDPATTGDDEAPPKKRRSGKRLAVVCRCDTPRRLQVSPKCLEDGPLLCGNCRKEFEPDQAEDDD
ncbi:hypothetical protein [Streptomyces alboflavus]|uniref:hypothetical protein n=1 Tax=Streptomyces alboflavus TaxID=67267 RepID=UPI000F656D74|nr:hypothetical protein [Streptomyces alboflavus]